MENFPSNSNEPRAKRSDAPEEKHFERVIETPVVRQKKTLGSRLRDLLFNGDNIVEYVMNEVLLPAFKDTMSDAVSTAVNRALFGESDARSRKPSTRTSAFGGGTHTNYNRYSTPSRNESPRSIPRRGRTSSSFETIIIASRVEAQIIMDQMHKAVEKYGMVSIRDLYEMVGESFHYTDNDFGWTDLSSARIRQVRSGWMLALPDPEPLE